MPPTVKITVLLDRGDERGHGFSPPADWKQFLGSVEDLHLTTIRPGHVRGNHFHRIRREALVVLHHDRWSFHWNLGEGTRAEWREFTGRGAALIEIEPPAAHAVVCDGDSDLVVFGLTNDVYDPAAPDAFPRPLV